MFSFTFLLFNFLFFFFLFPSPFLFSLLLFFQSGKFVVQGRRLRRKICCPAESRPLPNRSSSAARQKRFCCPTEIRPLHGKKNSEARQILRCGGDIPKSLHRYLFAEKRSCGARILQFAKKTVNLHSQNQNVRLLKE